MTPYYQDEAVTLYHGDQCDIMPYLKADVVVMDPPYNCGVKYGKLVNDNLPWPEWCAWFDDVVTACKDVAPDVFSFLSQTAAKKYERLGHHERDWCLIWNKPLSLAICAAPFMPHWEPIFYWGKAKRTKEAGARWGSDVVLCNVEFGKNRWSHPTPKPLVAMLDLCAKFDGVICDPFAGSGTTLAAAKILGKQAIGIEIDERYCEIIAKRVGQARKVFQEAFTYGLQ